MSVAEPPQPAGGDRLLLVHPRERDADVDQHPVTGLRAVVVDVEEADAHSDLPPLACNLSLVTKTASSAEG